MAQQQQQQPLWKRLTARLEEGIRSDDERHQRAGKMASVLNAALVRAEMAHEAGGDDADADAEEAALDKLVREVALSPDGRNGVVHDVYLRGRGVGGGEGGSAAAEEQEAEAMAPHPRAPRVCNIGSRMEDYARYKALRHFLAEGSLLPPDAPCFLVGTPPRSIVTDEEYLGGACIGLCHDLARHGVARASSASEDPTAVPFLRGARDAAALILEELLQFDFRNGPLRRKYDGTKYALKTLETVLYELSVAGAVGGHEGLVVDEEDGGPVKRMRQDEEGKEKGAEEEGEASAEEGGTASPPPVVPKREIAAIRERMDRRDALRERLIKTSRDGQKAAKQAIFALHRGDAARAAKLLKDCEDCVTGHLLPILEEEPALRSGTFAGVLEEYAEGRLFYAWLYGEEDDDGGEEGAVGGAPGDGNGSSSPRAGAVAGRILLPDEMPLRMSTDDYLGGLCDLTGEIGRFAVARGTARDKAGVRLCLDSSRAVHATLRTIGKVPRGASKKMGMVGRTVEKLDRMLYEQSLMEMTGRKDFCSSVEEDLGHRANDAGGGDN